VLVVAVLVGLSVGGVSGAARAQAATVSAFKSVSGGGYHTCGVQSDGHVACWGRNNHGEAALPAGTFTSVSAGVDHTCGVRTDERVACWGRNHEGQSQVP
jgi:alpha-tubulin suppressor-like RCC1 family protein